MATIDTSKSFEEVVEAVRSAVANMSGQSGFGGAVGRFYHGIGVAYFKAVKHAFDAKAAGGNDDNGDSWEKLKPETVVKRKSGFSKVVSSLRSSRGKVSRPDRRGARTSLDDDQDARWRLLYRKAYSRFKGRNLSSKEASKKAAQRAWFLLKTEGARTLRDIAESDTDVKILKDTGELYESLLPPGEGNSAHRVFRVNRGQLEVGSDLPYYEAHVNGVPEKKIPARPPIEPDMDRWRSGGLYETLVMDAVTEGLMLVITEALV